MGFDLWDETKSVAVIMQEAAEKEIMPRFGKQIERKEKQTSSGRELVTEADIRASRYILDRVRKRFPGSYSEEHLHDDRFNYERIWQFDPLDGTNEFSAGMRNGFAMHGAFLERQKNGEYRAKAGILYIPGEKKLWMADDGNFSFKINGRETAIDKPRKDLVRGWIRKSDINSPGAIFYNNGNEVDSIKELKSIYRKIANGLKLSDKIIAGGGSGASFSDLLEDKVNLLILNWNNSKEWDIAMTEPIVKVRGGFLCDFQGNEYSYNRKDHLNRLGYVASITFKKEEIMPYLNTGMVLIKNQKA